MLSLALLYVGVGRHADLLSHEATFTADMYAKARVAQHSTAPMAGNFARQLGAQTLVLTHFSGRFTEFRGKVCLSGQRDPTGDMLRMITKYEGFMAAPTCLVQVLLPFIMPFLVTIVPAGR
jgi:ribonuclease BN (tRNA processing enzyme)